MDGLGSPEARIAIGFHLSHSHFARVVVSGAGTRALVGDGTLPIELVEAGAGLEAGRELRGDGSSGVSLPG